MKKGIEISQPQMKSLNLEYNNTVPQWYYSIKLQTRNDTVSVEAN